jgi:hypothetical protein
MNQTALRLDRGVRSFESGAVFDVDGVKFETAAFP